MRFKKLFLPLVLMTALVGAAALPALANCKMHGKMDGKMGGKSCPMMKDGAGSGKCAMGHAGCSMSHGCKHGGSKDHGASQCPITAKAMWTAHELLEHRTDLGLTADETTKIKQIKLELKKGCIRQSAEMQVFMIDMNVALAEQPVNVEKIENMIDSGMAAMATSGKAAVKAYADLQAILTPERMAKMKEGHHQMAGGHEDHAE